VPDTIIIYFDNQIFCTQIVVVQNFNKVYFVSCTIDLFMKINRFVIQKREDPDLLQVINGTLEAMVPRIGSPVVKIVVQCLEPFDLLISIIGENGTLIGKHQLLLTLVVEKRQKRQNEYNKQQIERQKTQK
jgi:hypothetical protein